MNVIEARGLTKVYGGRAVVSDFAMTVAAGDIYGFVGKNGAGKSTVMKMICGDVLPTAGEVVLFEGDRVSAGAAGAARAAGSAGDGEGVRRIGVLIEELALLPNLSAYRNLEAKALAWGIVDGPALCEEALRLVGLSSVGNKKVRGFSLGMKQRLGLAMALLGNPDVLLLDEPFNGLDPEATRAMRNLIVRLAESLGITVVVSSHVLDQLDRMATRYGVIADGRMVREMTAEEVAAECRSSLRVRTENPAQGPGAFGRGVSRARLQSGAGRGPCRRGRLRRWCHQPPACPLRRGGARAVSRPSRFGRVLRGTDGRGRAVCLTC